MCSMALNTGFAFKLSWLGCCKVSLLSWPFWHLLSLVLAMGLHFSFREPPPLLWICVAYEHLTLPLRVLLVEQTQAWPISIFKHAGHSDQISDGHTPVSLHWELIVGFLTKLLGGNKNNFWLSFLNR